ncbi:MAG: creatininase family protein [Pseudomonadota bacterium]
MTRAIGHRFWATLGREALSRLDRDRTVVIVPVAAIEQHGPHLPFGVDRILGEGLLVEMFHRLAGDVPAVAVPQIAVGKSDEHQGFSGTLSLSPETLIGVLSEIGTSIAWSGFRKILFLSSHGGNSECISLAARRLRLQHDLFAVSGHWPRFGVPEGLFSEEELRFGIHAGAIETSMMLALRPDLVDMTKAGDFRSHGQDMAEEMTWLGMGGSFPLGWRTEDLNPEGAVGSADTATAEAGQAVIAHQAAACAELVAEISQFDLGRLSR